ncbi:MAG: NIPSNAP family protein [Pseudomonadota bacterium]
MIYELRTYTLKVGKMQEALQVYQEKATPFLERSSDHLVGYFLGDVGAMNQIIHVWKYQDDGERRAFWERTFADADFQAFAAEFRPLVLTQENKLMVNAPWGPKP